MLVRYVLPVAAVGLAVIAPGPVAAQGSASTQVRPAQVTGPGPCDALVREVESAIPSGVGMRVHDAQRDLQQAQDLCNSGQSAQGNAMLRQILGYIREEP
jgi:hypothetical protein